MNDLYEKPFTEKNTDGVTFFFINDLNFLVHECL